MRQAVWLGVFVFGLGLVLNAAAAQPGGGIRLDEATVLHPYAQLQAGYDSNVEYLETDEQDDFFAQLRAGLALDRSTEQFGLQGDVWGLIERFADLTDEDHEDFGETLALRYGKRDALEATLSESYADIEELDYGTGQRENRADMRAKGALGKQFTDKLEGDVDYSYRSSDYTAKRNGYELYDWNQHGPRAQVAHALTDKTAAVLTGEYLFLSSDGNREDADYTSAEIGLKTRHTDKLTGIIGAGWHQLDTDDNIDGLSATIEGLWQANERCLVRVQGGNSIEPSVQDADNFVEIANLLLDVEYRIARSFQSTVMGVYRNNDYARPVTVGGVSQDKEEDFLTGLVRLTYLPPSKFLSYFVEGRVESKDSNLEGSDYDQVVGLIGAQVAY